MNAGPGETFVRTQCCSKARGFLAHPASAAAAAVDVPGTFAYVYLGSVGKVAADAAGGSDAGGLDPIKIVLYGKYVGEWDVCTWLLLNDVMSCQ
jgi:hypothetical protein